MFKALLELGPKAAWQRLEFKNSLGASVWGIPEVEPSEHEPGYMVTIKYNGTIIAFITSTRWNTVKMKTAPIRRQVVATKLWVECPRCGCAFEMLCSETEAVRPNCGLEVITLREEDNAA